MLGASSMLPIILIGDDLDSRMRIRYLMQSWFYRLRVVKRSTDACGITIYIGRVQCCEPPKEIN